ncbi:hypothetical protein [Iningainema tapete]
MDLLNPNEVIAMCVDVISLVLLVIVEKSAEIILELLLKKFWEWVLSDDNLKRLVTSFKLQILVLYLDWLLQKPHYRKNFEE